VLAGLELQRRLRDAQDEVLEMRMGLHTALVTVGGVGDDPATTVAVVGDAVAHAAALQEQAARG
jgi:class 3 adenylate cyclase